MPSAAPRLAGRGGKGTSEAAVPEHIPGSDGLHQRGGSAADGGLSAAESASLVGRLKWVVRIPRPNDGLSLSLQLSQLQVELEQVGQHLILGAPAVELNSIEYKKEARKP
jgi:hypothetical protein